MRKPGTAGVLSHVSFSDPFIFFCEFDGPRNDRSVVVTMLADT